MPEPRRYAVAIVGAGIGAEHVTGYLELADRFRVATVCDLDRARAEALAARVPGCAATTDVHAALVDPDIDLVDVCLPPALHVDLVGRSLDAGKHVVCEKPLAGSLADVDALARAAHSADRVLAPVFQYRYGRGVAQLLRLVASGLVGRPFLAALETHWDRGADYYAVPWRGTLAGELGGAVLGHAIHIHDLLCSVLGPVARVNAFTATRVNDIEVEDTAAIVFQMVNGALATSSITLGAAGNQSRLRFCFENVTAESGLDPYRPASGVWRFTARDPERQGEVDAVIAAVDDGPAGFAGFFAALHRVLEGADPRAPLVADARRSIELVTAIYRAARCAEAVCLPLGDAAASDDGPPP